MARSREDGATALREQVLRVESGVAKFKQWILLDVNRYGLAFAPLLVGFLLFFWLAIAGVFDVRRTTTPMLYLFSALAGGNVTLITIVVSINQLVLSRELRSPRELQMEMDAAEAFREEVEAEGDFVVMPERPAEFLELLVEDTRDQVSRLDAGERDSAFESDLADLVVSLEDELDETARRLERSRGGVFPALATILDAEFSTHINHIRWLGRTYGDEIPDATAVLLDDLEDRLEQLDVARQYFKTIYIQQELADVSNLVMGTGLVAVVVSIVALMVTGYRTTPFPGALHLLVVPLGVTTNLVPLALLIAHVLRISTVARRTAAITPFLSPSE